MRPLHQAFAHAESGCRQHQHRKHPAGTAPAQQEISRDESRHDDNRLARDHGRKPAQTIEPGRRHVEQPSAIQIGLVGKGERKQIAAGHTARAQDLLAIGQAEKYIRLLQRDEAEPGDKKSEPQQRHEWVSPGPAIAN